MRTSEAETLALKALAHLAAEPDALLRFLTLSGLTLEDLRERAADPELLAAVMDFLLAEDALSSSFAGTEDLRPEELHAIRRALPGAAL
jgi:hypothetical protein